MLQPDKLADLAEYTPITGIYLEMVGRETPSAADDWSIFAHQDACCARLTNAPGHLDLAVNTLIHLIKAYSENETSQGGLYATNTPDAHHYRTPSFD